MDDLIELNMRMAQHQAGNLIEQQRAYLAYVTSCLARLVPTADEMRRFLACDTKSAHENPIAIVSINREYLNFARLVAKEIVAGHAEKLVILGVGWEQAEVMAGLTNKQITRLALHWNGLIYQLEAEAIEQGARLHPSAAPYHAAAC